MKRHPKARTGQERLDEATHTALCGWLALTASLNIAEFGLGGPARLLVHAVILLILVPSSCALISYLRRSGTARPASPDPATETQQVGRQGEIISGGSSILIALYVFMCLIYGGDVLEMLRNPALAWGYKAGIVVAVNVCAFALSRAVPLALPHLKTLVRRPASRPAAATVSTNAQTNAQTNDVPLVPAEAGPVPLVAERNRQSR